MAAITRDGDPVASLLVPDDTSQAALIELFDALDDAGFGIAHRDGYDSRDAFAYDITGTSSLIDIESADPDVRDPDERSLEVAISGTETQITDALYERVLDNVEVDV
jgi:hypothetical protein